MMCYEHLCNTGRADAPHFAKPVAENIEKLVLQCHVRRHCRLLLYYIVLYCIMLYHIISAPRRVAVGRLGAAPPLRPCCAAQEQPFPRITA